MYTLGIDGGASSTKWTLRHLVDTSTIEGSSEPIDGHVYREDSRVRLVSVLREIKRFVGSEAITSIYAGITGISHESLNAVKEIFQGEFPGSVIEVVTDIFLGYQSHFDLGSGIYLYGGTGSIGIYIDEDSKLIRSGGWGYLLGDEGSGYWVGREAIRRTILKLEMESELEIFEKKILEVICADNWDKIKAFVYCQHRSAVGAY